MLDNEMLLELKRKMPTNYVAKVIEVYNSQTGENISRWTVMRFFKGKTYNEQLHSAILSVAKMQQSLLTQTENIING